MGRIKCSKPDHVVLCCELHNSAVTQSGIYLRLHERLLFPCVIYRNTSDSKVETRMTLEKENLAISTQVYRLRCLVVLDKDV